MYKISYNPNMLLGIPQQAQDRDNTNEWQIDDWEEWDVLIINK